MPSPLASPSSLMSTTISLKRSPSFAPPGACGQNSCESGTGQEIRDPGCSGLKPRRRDLCSPYNNVVRVSIQALAAILGGVQSLHTNALDETLALPTQEAATIALRTQQIIAHETGVTHTIDPVGGSYFVESLTREVEEEVWNYLHKIDDLGGMVRAVEQGFPQKEIVDASYRYQQTVEAGGEGRGGGNR